MKATVLMLSQAQLTNTKQNVFPTDRFPSSYGLEKVSFKLMIRRWQTLH
jgi:hypothetical protein